MAASHAIVDWLTQSGIRIVDPAEFVAAYGEQLREHGSQVDRFTTGIPVLHPQIDSTSLLWEPDAEVVERRWRLDPDIQQIYENSPLYVVYNGGGAVRCNLTTPPADGEYGILAELREAGFTDYLVQPAPFSDGTTKAVTYATRNPSGFSDKDVATLEAANVPLSMILEIQTLRRTGQTLMDTYVGPVTGRRVLDGAIKRGTGETIRAVIWFCDLRGFTELSSSLERDDLIELLNDYFGVMTTAVERRGGEILKFIGDAILAIFPYDGEADRADAAHSALGAARMAQEVVETLNAERVGRGKTPIRYGIALHLGDVMYGNVGGPNRLDFTVIGPAVNLASRLESLCRELGETLIASADFAQTYGADSWKELGRYELKGVEEPQVAYSPGGF